MLSQLNSNVLISSSPSFNKTGFSIWKCCQSHKHLWCWRGIVETQLLFTLCYFAMLMANSCTNHVVCSCTHYKDHHLSSTRTTTTATDLFCTSRWMWCLLIRHKFLLIRILHSVCLFVCLPHTIVAHMLLVFFSVMVTFLNYPGSVSGWTVTVVLSGSAKANCQKSHTLTLRQSSCSISCRNQISLWGSINSLILIQISEAHVGQMKADECSRLHIL